MDGRQFSGTSFDWVSPFPLATGVALMFGYGLLGAGWLILKTEGDLQDWARRAGRMCLVGVIIAIVAVSIWTPMTHPDIAQRWFSWPDIAFLSPVPIATALSRVGMVRAEPSLRIVAFPGRGRPFPVVLRWHRDQPVAVHRTVPIHALAGRLVPEHASLPADRHALLAAGDPDVHCLVVLGVPRQSQCEPGVSLGDHTGLAWSREWCGRFVDRTNGFESMFDTTPLQSVRQGAR